MIDVTPSNDLTEQLTDLGALSRLLHLFPQFETSGRIGNHVLTLEGGGQQVLFSRDSTEGPIPQVFWDAAMISTALSGHLSPLPRELKFLETKYWGVVWSTVEDGSPERRSIAIGLALLAYYMRSWRKYAAKTELLLELVHSGKRSFISTIVLAEAAMQAEEARSVSDDPVPVIIDVTQDARTAALV